MFLDDASDHTARVKFVLNANCMCHLFELAGRCSHLSHTHRSPTTVDISLK